MLNNIQDDSISLNEENHVYSLKDDNTVFTSVTTFIGQFFKEFDYEELAEKLLLSSNNKYYSMKKEDIIADWDKSRDYGTLVHKEIEDHFNNVREASDIKSRKAVEWLAEYLEKEYQRNISEVNIDVEKIVFSKELKIAGTIDALIHFPDREEYIIIDWKTNKKMTKKSINNQMGIHPITKKIEDCKYNLYAFQLSMYRYLLEVYYGFKVKKQIIAHIDNNGVNEYLTHYCKDIMKAMVKWEQYDEGQKIAALKDIEKDINNLRKEA